MSKRFIICLCLYTLATSTLFAQDRKPPEMSAAMKQAFDGCHTSLKIAKPDQSSNVRPSREQMESLRACVEAKGFELPAPPEHRGEGRHHHDDEQQQQNSSAPNQTAQ